MKILLVFLLVEAITSHPYGTGYGQVPRTVMFGGYYGHPGAPSGVPQGAMTFAAGDTIATNSYFGEERPVEDTTERKLTRNQEFDENLDVEAASASASSTQRTPKRRPPQKDEEDDEEAQGSWPFQGGQKGVPSYNAFFPIMFGGSNARGRNGDEGYYPGPATAIANSFSTGKGGVATSHATSFGDPYFSTLLRNGGMNPAFNRKAPQV